MHKYRLLSKKGEGTFSEVLKAQAIKSGKYVGIKCMKNHFDSLEQVNNLREIQALRRLAGHPNIIRLHEVLYDEPTGRLALVFELMDMNLYEAIKGRRHYLPEQKVRQYVYDLMKALDHMHRNGIFHRDVKPENLLLLDDEIKLADLGSCRGIYSRQPYTEYISTRWYRAPECLLTDGYYGFKMDIFAAGCVWFEIMALFPLFPGKDELDQIQKIHNILGTPSEAFLRKKFNLSQAHADFNFVERKGTGIERLVPHADPEAVELIKRLIRYDPDERALARQVLKDHYFRSIREADKARATAARSAAAAAVDAALAPEFVPQQSQPANTADAATTGQGVAQGTASPKAGKVGGAGLPQISTIERTVLRRGQSTLAASTGSLGVGIAPLGANGAGCVADAAVPSGDGRSASPEGRSGGASGLPTIGKKRGTVQGRGWKEQSRGALANAAERMRSTWAPSPSRRSILH